MKVKQSNVTEGSEFDIHHHIKDPGALKAEKNQPQKTQNNITFVTSTHEIHHFM